MVLKESLPSIIDRTLQAIIADTAAARIMKHDALDQRRSRDGMNEEDGPNTESLHSFNHPPLDDGTIKEVTQQFELVSSAGRFSMRLE
jgi:hypothetical protein